MLILVFVVGPKKIYCMFNNENGVSTSRFVSLSAQNVQWSHQQVLALLSQIFLLLISMLILTSVIINLGERSLQEDWAEQRYSELQTVGTLTADKINFLQFRTQTLSRGDLLNQYSKAPTPALQQKLISNWQKLSDTIPELLGVTLYDTQGRLKFSSNSNFDNIQLPPALLNKSSSMGRNDVYSSPMAFIPTNGLLGPYIYQLVRLENKAYGLTGFLVVFNSVSSVLDSIKPAFFNHNSPLLLLDSQGFLYAGANQAMPLETMPDTLGANIKQSNPELWRHIAMSNYGQFHALDTTFVHLKVQLATEQDFPQDYVLLSYIRHDDIAARFEQWKIILIISALIISLLASLLIIFRHRFVLEKKAKLNSMRLANGLFNSDLICIIANDNGRVISANPKAADIIGLPLDELRDRSLQRILHLDENRFGQIKATLEEEGQWSGEFSLDTINGCTLKAHIRREYKNKYEGCYWLVTLEDVSQLLKSQQQGYLYQLLCDSAVATVLTDASGNLLKFNSEFDNLMELHGEHQHSLVELLGDEMQAQWPHISAQISLQGQWSGQVISCSNCRFSACLKTTLKGLLTVEGDIEYIICTLEIASPVLDKQAKPNNVLGHHSSIVLKVNELETHFNSLSESAKEASSLMVMDINPEGIISHLSDIALLEKRQKEIELHLLNALPNQYQVAQWQLGKLVIWLPQTSSTEAHQYARITLSSLEENELAEGINIGIAGYLMPQTLESYLQNADIALKRAKQSNDQRICQAFTRQHHSA
jgi:PAS domain S-box-containing protein